MIHRGCGIGEQVVEPEMAWLGPGLEQSELAEVAEVGDRGQG